MTSINTKMNTPKYILILAFCSLLFSCSKSKLNFEEQVVITLQEDLIKTAKSNLKEEPITVTSAYCSRSARCSS